MHSGSLQNTTKSKSKRLLTRCHNFNRRVVVLLFTIGLLLDGCQLQDAMYISGTIIWLWMDEFDMAELRFSRWYARHHKHDLQ